MDPSTHAGVDHVLDGYARRWVIVDNNDYNNNNNKDDDNDDGGGGGDGRGSR